MDEDYGDGGGVNDGSDEENCNMNEVKQALSNNRNFRSRCLLMKLICSATACTPL